jgi:hypothetical protein
MVWADDGGAVVRACPFLTVEFGKRASLEGSFFIKTYL